MPPMLLGMCNIIQDKLNSRVSLEIGQHGYPEG